MINNLNLSECLDDVVTKEPSDVVSQKMVIMLVWILVLVHVGGR